MPALRELQEAFRSGLLSGDEDALTRHIRANGLTGPRRLQVYRNNVISSLTEALAAVHPVVQKLVGEGFFAYAADTFIRTHPSASGDLHDFGEHFSAFLKTFPPARELKYLPDVARLEWFYHEVYHEADHPPLDISRLASLSPEAYGDIVWKIHPARRWLRSGFPLMRIWQVNQDDWEGDETVDLGSGGDILLITRQEEVEFHPLSAPEFAFLEAAAAGGTLSEVIDQVVNTHAEFDLHQCLQRLVQNQTLVDFA